MSENNTNNTVQLTKKLKNKIDDICEEGDLLIIDFFDYQQAIQKYKEALEFVPEPREEHNITTWIYTAIGDAYYLDDDYSKAMEYFQEVLKLPTGDNALSNLRIGQCFHKQDDLELAKKHLIIAYQFGGAETFEEYEDYLDLIKEFI